MKLSLFLALLLVGLNVATASAACGARNFIFLIHGISGGQGTFGSMPEYLHAADACNRVSNFIYDTGNDKLNVYDFAQGLDAFIREKTTKEGFVPSDRISLIMHSQGGLVGSVWLNKMRIEDAALYKQVDSFITLSTPYWGSFMATVGSRFFYTLPRGMGNPISPMGRIELREMRYGSDTVRNLQLSYDELFKNSHVRLLALGGLKTIANAFVGEDDNTVPVYSSNPDHYAYSGELSLTGSTDVAAKAFTKTTNGTFIAVPATHFRAERPGIAKIDDSCTLEECDHPSMGHIMKHLNGEKPQGPKSYSFRRYRVQVFINNEHNAEDVEDLEYEIDDPSVEKQKSFELKSGEVASETFSGKLETSDEQEVSIHIKSNRKIIQTIRTPVSGGFTTFVHLNVVR